VCIKRKKAVLRIRIRMDPHDLVSWIRTRSGKKDFLYYSLARHSVVTSKGMDFFLDPHPHFFDADPQTLYRR
jgi:hypothetical protein